MMRAALSLCLTSRYDDGSSNMYLPLVNYLGSANKRKNENLHVGFLHTNSTDGEALKLTARKQCNITVINVA